MSEYTNNQNIYFLNDRNIAQSLSDDQKIALNPIPSLKRLADTCSDVSAKLEQSIEQSAGQLEAKISETSASLQDTLSSYSNSLFYKSQENLRDVSSMIQSEVVHLSGNEAIENDLSVKGRLASDLTRFNRLFVNDHFLRYASGTKVVANFVDGIVLDNAKGPIYLNAENGVSSIIVTDNTLSTSSSMSKIINDVAKDKASKVMKRIQDDKYVITDGFEFNSLTNTHRLEISFKNCANELCSYSIDTTDFIKNRLLEKAEVCRQEMTNMQVLRLWWYGVEKGPNNPTDIGISNLTQIYKEGYGIKIGDNLSISVNDEVAKASDVRSLSTCLNEICSQYATIKPMLEEAKTIISQLSSQVEDMKQFVNGISDDIIWLKSIHA